MTPPMTVIDSLGWVHYFMNGDLAEAYADYISKPGNIVTPTVVLYEVFKILKSQLGEEAALGAAAQMTKTNTFPLTGELAYFAANISLEYKLSMADAIIYATAQAHQATLVTSDADFKGLPKVDYIS